MGLFILAVALMLLVGGAATLVRSSRRREAEMEAELLAAIRDLSTGSARLEIAIGPEDIVAGGTPSNRSLPRKRLREALRRGHPARDVATAALALLESPPRPLGGSFSLKIHGPQVRARLATPAAMAIRPRHPRPAQTPLDDLSLVATYAVGERFLTEEHLSEQGIDTRDLHGIALAVQRQHFDEELTRRALAAGAPGAPAEILRSADGSAGAALLTVADTLRPGEALSARLAGPDWLGLAPLGFTWPAGGDAVEAGPVGTSVDLVVEPSGYRIR